MEKTKAKITFKDFMKKFYFSFIWLMVLIFVADIVTKWSFVKYFASQEGPIQQIQIIPNFLYISLGFNQGMAWSLLSGDKGQIVLACVSFILGGFLIFYYVKNYKKLPTSYKVPLALMIAGAYGNFIDRAFYWEGLTGNPSGVIDWIQVYFGDYAFPTFNIADSALVIGVAIIIVLMIIEMIKDARKAEKEGKYKYSPNELKAKEEAENKPVSETKDEENKDK